MPTGFTADLCERDDVTFEEFLWRCVRGMTVCITMRDEPLSVPPPERFEPDVSYYEERLAQAKARILELRAMVPTRCEAEAEKEYVAAQKHNEESAESHRVVRDRLMRMRMRVADWTPPTSDHQGLKRFALEQIDETIKWDGTHHPITATKLTGPEWFEKELADAVDDLRSAEKDIAEAIESTERRNAFLKALRDSVPMPVRSR